MKDEGRADAPAHRDIVTFFSFVLLPGWTSSETSIFYHSYYFKEEKERSKFK